ncbi:hypothetical protein [uncultured Nostoc sp.]|uniref:hypothetical protein n=1 Tax=uncultured Nostoc sp. TaxID=340711 RepID=UPI0035CC5101
MLKLIQDGVRELVKPESCEETTESKHGFHDVDPSEIEELRKLAGLSSPPTVRKSPHRPLHNLSQNHRPQHLHSESIHNIKPTRNNNLVRGMSSNKSEVLPNISEDEISR